LTGFLQNQNLFFLADEQGEGEPGFIESSGISLLKLRSDEYYSELREQASSSCIRFFGDTLFKITENTCSL